MSKWIPLVSVSLFASFAAAVVFAADGTTGAESSVCDDLATATPGLYGLCIAFCEAQECDADKLATGDCGPGADKVLENYNKRKDDDDPGMPCIKAECPCFDEADLDAIAATATDSSPLRYSYRTDATYGVYYDRISTSGRISALMLAEGPDSTVNMCLLQTNSTGMRMYRISDDEQTACQTLLRDYATDHGLR